MWVMWLLACGEPERIVSEPSEPAVELGGDVQGDDPIVWTDLDGLFAEGPVALPPVLADLEPEMPGARAREVLDAAHRPGVKIFAKVIRGHMVVQTLLDAYPSVGVTLILDEGGESLQEVDLSLPHAQALVLLGKKWGDPGETTFDDEGKAVYTWKGEPWKAELREVGDKAVVKFSLAR